LIRNAIPQPTADRTNTVASGTAVVSD
jgi:hypothetical protein